MLLFYRLKNIYPEINVIKINKERKRKREDEGMRERERVAKRKKEGGEGGER